MSRALYMYDTLEQVCNPGLLPTSVTVNLPNAKPVEMETWANQGEPTAEVCDDSEVFVGYPKRLGYSSVLLPGKTFRITPKSYRALFFTVYRENGYR